MIPPDEETTPPETTTGNPGGNGATTPPKHKSGRKPKHHHVPKERKHVPGHGVKARNTHGHPTHEGHSTHRKPSTKGRHSRKAIPAEARSAGSVHHVSEAIGARTAHSNSRQKALPINRDMKKVEEETRKGRKPPEKRVAKRSSRLRAK